MIHDLFSEESRGNVEIRLCHKVKESEENILPDPPSSLDLHQNVNGFFRDTYHILPPSLVIIQSSSFLCNLAYKQTN